MSRPLHTGVAFEESSKKIGLKTGALFIGSCFAEKIGRRLLDLRFPNVVVNPFGITYNPISLCQQLASLSSASLGIPPLFQHNGLWHSWAHHGRFSHPERAVVERRIEAEFHAGFTALKSAHHLILTLGTAWVHRTDKEGMVVNNRHKMPGDHFQAKDLLSVSQIVETLGKAIEELPPQGDRSVLLSVSPIRHWKEGAVDNAASKGGLLHACHTLTSYFSEVDYLPAYEVMMDELRDYRFYAEDMLHPSALAEDIIWQRFITAYFEKDAQEFISEMEAYQKMKAHRILHPDTEEARSFSEKLDGRERELVKKYGFLEGRIGE